MTTRTVELVPEWDTVPFDGGYAGLQALADREFSGAVVSGPTRLFMLNGTVIGVLDGDIEDFESGGGTARAAPHEALPLLAVMQERADEVRAKYYTQDTPLEDVDRTLADGNFTGFVELSENVLSGDYYLVYHQGRSMSVAWVGSAERLITDDEAFEQANDEVGIYEVKPAEISPVEIPGARDDASAGPGGTAAGAAGDDEADRTADESPGAAPAESATEAGDVAPEQTSADPSGGSAAAGDGQAASTDRAAGDDEARSTDRRRSDRASGGPPGSKAVGGRQDAGTDQSGAADRDETRDDDGGTAPEEQTAPERDDPTTSGDATAATDRRRSEEPDTHERSETAQRAEAADAGRAETARTGDRPSSGSPAGESGPESASVASEAARPESTGTATDPSAGTSEGDAPGGTSAADLETKSVPSLDPDRSRQTPEPAVGDAGGNGGTASAAAPARGGETDGESARNGDSQASPKGGARQSPDRSSQPDRTADLAAELDDRDAEIERLTTELDEREAEIDRLTDDLAAAESTNEELRAERDRLESDLEDARAEVQELRARLQEVEAENTPDAGTRLSPTEAIDGTNLFVRYDSKGEATLAQAHDGDADREDVEANLRLEYHTQFDGSDATVDGTPFEAFLHDSIQYRFVDWLVRRLLYEIRDTGHAGAMQDLYDAIPNVDRAELNGKVSVTYTEDGEQHRTQEQFDVVVRDRMGNPLIVANINDSRQPASESQMTDIVRDAERVGNASESLAAAFLVTSSFFEPGALETAEDATASGLLSRDKRESFVNLSRKDGYHLCLLEARNQEFHLAVPEL